jgi:D-beta-D-heptose 7-phosphate kinase/D-beta-D-heptose 1-phosphate adenosyltransferase
MFANPAECLKRFAEVKALVIGDVMLDSYLSGESCRLCPEAPVPIVDVQQRQNAPGGAANCARNLARLGAQTEILGALGDDCNGEVLRRLLIADGIVCPQLRALQGRTTLTKTRIAAGDQVVVRFDEGTTASLEAQAEHELCEVLTRAYPRADLVVISDYNYGVITPNVISHLCALQRQCPTTVVLDSKRRLPAFRQLGAKLCKPNYREALDLLGASAASTNCYRWETAQALGPALLSATGAEAVALTLDCDGAMIFEHGRWPYRTYATPARSKTTAGAGDTYLSAFGLALAAGLEMQVGAEVAAAAAAVVVEKPFTATCSLDELAARITGEPIHRNDLAALQAAVNEYRNRGRRVVFTNGCFDILHRGHIAYLEQAKRLGDVLIVGVNADDSIRRLKGPTRPINSLVDRIRVLSALSSVNHVISFDADTPHRLIEAIRPDIFVKGGDYTRATLPEASLVERYGGAVKILPFVADRSTSGMIHRICNVYRDEASDAGRLATTTGADRRSAGVGLPSC